MVESGTGNSGFSYDIRYTKVAEKFFRAHEAAIRELLVGEHPEKVDIKKIKGKRSDYYRIRLGDYRVVYALINGAIVVVNTILAGASGDVYKKMSGWKQGYSRSTRADILVTVIKPSG